MLALESFILLFNNNSNLKYTSFNNEIYFIVKAICFYC